MLKTKPQPGTKIRCINDGGWYFLTKGKIYEVLPEDGGIYYSGGFAFLDDEGDYCWHNIEHDPEKFELVQEEKTQMNNTNTANTAEQTPDDFKVGDVVYDVVKGKGKVAEINIGNTYPVMVDFSEGDSSTYTIDGRQWIEYPRTLFFSEPKIEASVKRPFTPTLIGKTVVVEYKDGSYFAAPAMIDGETATHLSSDEDLWVKADLKAIYEVSSENLLTSTKN